MSPQRFSATCQCGKKVAWFNRDLFSGLCRECARERARQRKEANPSEQGVAPKVLVAVLTVALGIVAAYVRYQSRMKRWEARDAQRRQAEQQPWEADVAPDERSVEDLNEEIYDVYFRQNQRLVPAPAPSGRPADSRPQERGFLDPPPEPIGPW
jgi:hypothetical protein